MTDKKVVIIGDTHFGFKNGDAYFLEFQKGWFSEHLLPYCKQNNIKTIIQTGDFFDIRKHMNLNVMDMVLHWLPEQLESAGINTLILPAGNHDLYYRDINSISSIDLLNTLNSDKLTVHTVKNNVCVFDVFNSRLAVMPYLSKDEKDRLLVELSDKENVDYLVAHLDVIGMPMVNGHICEHGVELDQFKSYKRVISGHFHIPSAHKNLTITGAPFVLNWGDVADQVPRGFYVLDTETDDLEFVPNPEFLTLFSVIEYDIEEKYNEDSFKNYEGNIVKVIVNKKDNEKHYKQFTKLLNDAAFLSYSIIDVSEQKVENVVISEKTLMLNTISAIGEYIDKQDTDVDRESLKQLAAEIYGEVTNG